MSISYRRRKKAIKAEKKRLGESPIPPAEFAKLRAGWKRQAEHEAQQ